MEVVSACDPLNLVGIITPGDKVPAVLGNRVVFQDGAPVASLESGKIVNRSAADSAAMAKAYSLLQMPRLGGSDRQGAWN
jgi:ATP-dependent Lhr-like helicase